jgi:hypothetical protein
MRACGGERRETGEAGKGWGRAKAWKIPKEEKDKAEILVVCPSHYSGNESSR